MLWWLYYAIMESSPKQATLGKIILGIKVTDLAGNRLSFWRASARCFGQLLSALTLGIGFVMAGLTRRKQALRGFQAALEPTRISGIELLPERLAPAPIGPVSLSEAEYDKLLSSQSIPSGKRMGTSVGPAALKLSRFWDYDERNPSFWIALRMIPLPNFTLFRHGWVGEPITTWQDVLPRL